MGWFRVGVALILLLSLLPLSYAVPPFQTSDGTDTLSIVYPKIDAITFGENVTVHVHVFNATGFPKNSSDVNCTIHIYDKDDTHLIKANMTYDVSEWEYNINGSLFYETGYYPFIIYCVKNDNVHGGYASGSIYVSYDGEEQKDNLTALYAFIPLLFGFLLVLGVKLFDPLEHWILHVFAYLLSLTSSFASLWFAGMTVMKFLDWTEMSEAITSWVFISGLMVGVIVIYWLIYTFVLIIQVAAQKKRERLKYE